MMARLEAAVASALISTSKENNFKVVLFEEEIEVLYNVRLWYPDIAERYRHLYE